MAQQSQRKAAPEDAAKFPGGNANGVKVGYGNPSPRTPYRSTKMSASAVIPRSCGEADEWARGTGLPPPRKPCSARATRSRSRCRKKPCLRYGRGAFFRLRDFRTMHLHNVLAWDSPLVARYIKRSTIHHDFAPHCAHRGRPHLSSSISAR